MWQRKWIKIPKNTPVHVGEDHTDTEYFNNDTLVLLRRVNRYTAQIWKGPEVENGYRTDGVPVFVALHYKEWDK